MEFGIRIFVSGITDPTLNYHAIARLPLDVQRIFQFLLFKSTVVDAITLGVFLNQHNTDLNVLLRIDDENIRVTEQFCCWPWRKVGDGCEGLQCHRRQDQQGMGF
jgi:hypothetical protein